MEEKIAPLIEGLNHFKTHQKPLLSDIKLSFDLFYFIFNSLKAKRLSLKEEMEPYKAVFSFKTILEGGKVVVKVEAGEENEELEINVWSEGNPESYIENMLANVKNLEGRIKNLNSQKLKKSLEVLKSIDTVLLSLIERDIMRRIYFPLANTRELLYKINEAEEFNPIIFSITSSLEKLKRYDENSKLNEEDYEKLSLNALKWKSHVLLEIKNVLS